MENNPNITYPPGTPPARQTPVQGPPFSGGGPALPKRSGKNPMIKVVAAIVLCVLLLLGVIIFIASQPAKKPTTQSTIDPLDVKEQITFRYKLEGRDEAKGIISDFYTLKANAPKGWRTTVAATAIDNNNAFGTCDFPTVWVTAKIKECSPWRFSSALSTVKNQFASTNSMKIYNLEEWATATWPPAGLPGGHLNSADPAKRKLLLENLLNIQRSTTITQETIFNNLLNPHTIVNFHNVQEMRFVEAKLGDLKGFAFLAQTQGEQYNPAAYFVVGRNFRSSPYILIAQFDIYDDRRLKLDTLLDEGHAEEHQKALERARNLQRYDEDTLKFYSTVIDFVESFEITQN